MVLETKALTVEEFDQIALLPENADKLLEFIGGNIVDAVSDHYASILGALMATELYKFVEKNNLGFVTGANGGYKINGERYIPSAAFMSKTRQAKPSREVYNSTSPDLVVEVLSRFDKPDEIAVKIVNYHLVVTVVWVVNPEQQYIRVYIPNRTPQLVGIDGVLDGGDVLPGFTLPVKDIFTD